LQKWKNGKITTAFAMQDTSRGKEGTYGRKYNEKNSSKPGVS